MHETREAIKQHRIETLRESIARVTDEKLSWSEIKKRVAQGDIIYIIALNVAKRKIEEMENRKSSLRMTRSWKIYESTRVLSYVLMVIYMGLSFFQKPTWCLAPPIYKPDENSYYDDCTGTVEEGNVIPISNLPYLRTWQLVLIEVICVTFLTARRYIKQTVKKKTSFSLFQAILVITILVYISEILQYGIGIKFPFNQFLRLVYFLAYIKSVRSSLRLYCRIVWRSREIFIVIAGVFLFFVCLAKVFFYESVQNSPGVFSFDTFTNTIYHLFVSLTTSNYPDVMMPIFTEERYSSIFFITFMTVLNLILLNIILAYFYFNYKEELLKEARLFQKSNSRIIDNIFEIDSQELDTHLGESGPLLQPQDQTKLIEEIGKIHQEEVKRIFDKSEWKRALMATLELFSIRTIFAMASLLTFILLVVQSSVVNPDPQQTYTDSEVAFAQKFNTYWLLIELGLNIFLLLDPLLRVISIGWKYFVESWFLMFEFSLSATIVGFITLKLTFIEDFSLTIIRIILLFRMWRFFQWVNSFPKYKLIFKTLYKLVPLFLDLLGVLTIAFYFYSTLGEVLFGGYLKTNTNINFNQYGDPAYYVYVNFNDFAMGLFTCFHLIIVNNWLFTVDVHCRTMGSFGYRIFFISFYIITVVVCLNIMIAFILDIYVTQIASKNKKFIARNHQKGDTLDDIDESPSPYRTSMVPYTPGGALRGEQYEEEKLESPRMRQSGGDFASKVNEISPTNQTLNLKLMSKQKET